MGSYAFIGDVVTAMHSFMRDHRVQGRPLAPAALLFEIATCSARLLTGEFMIHCYIILYVDPIGVV